MIVELWRVVHLWWPLLLCKVMANGFHPTTLTRFTSKKEDFNVPYMLRFQENRSISKCDGIFIVITNLYASVEKDLKRKRDITSVIGGTEAYNPAEIFSLICNEDADSRKEVQVDCFSVHHVRDPVAYPWQWSWKDVFGDGDFGTAMDDVDNEVMGLGFEYEAEEGEVNYNGSGREREDAAKKGWCKSKKKHSIPRFRSQPR
ncbi:hypothetical protein LR48_Vigan07g164200 [Vigna angularis]|uniref:Uncharacterized protein n=1 Tax=Phaseolus angularis TaxID=3914 RepID=A0A0L9UYW0_PHAAN|nr:hypothetical protein LR48_Vigan07g164200 [Vigna angularis]